MADPSPSAQVDSFIPLWGWDVPPPKKKKSSSSSSSKKSADATGSGGDGSLRSRSGKKSSSSKKKSLGLEDELQIEEATEGPDPTPHSGARIEEILEGEEDDDDE